MASIYFLTRGHIDHVEKFVRNMRSQYFPMAVKKKVKDEYGKEMEITETMNIDGQMRPIQLWEYAVPDEKFIQPLCNNLGLPTNETWFDKEPGEQTGSFISGFGVKGMLEAMRLALGADKLPEKDFTKGYWPMPIYKDFVNILGIGWRKDEQIKTRMGTHEGI